MRSATSKQILFIALSLTLISGIFYILLPGTTQVEKQEELPVLTPQEAPRDPEPPKIELQKTGIYGTVSLGEKGTAAAEASVSLLRAAKKGDSILQGIYHFPTKGFRLSQTKVNLAGRFFFPLPIPGRYLLRVEREGYCTEESDLLDVENTSSRFDLNLSLRPAASLRLRVGAENHSSPSFQLVLLGKGVEPKLAKIDKEGFFFFSPLRAGPYWIRVEAMDVDVSHYFWEALESAPSGPPDLLLNEGESKTLSLSLFGENLGSVSGVVFINRAPPEKTFTLLFRPVKVPEKFGSFRPEPPQAQTKTDGSFLLEKLAEGEYRVSLFASLGSPMLAEQDLVLRAGQAARLDFFVSLGRCKGRIVSAKSESVSQARVFLRKKEQGRLTLSLDCRTHTDGSFETEMVAAGVYELYIVPGISPPFTQQVELGQGETDLGEVLIP